MNQLKIFNNHEFGQVRTLLINGEAWFVGKDVAMILSYTNPQKAIRDHVDDEDKTVNDSFTVNGTSPVLINESGLYCLVLGSKLATAKKFRRWITAEVLPAIRQTGGYLSPQLLSDIFANPDNLNIFLKQMLKLSETNEDLKAEIKEIEPKAKYFDHMMNSDLLINFRTTAQEIGVRPLYFINFMLDHKYIYRNNRLELLPYQNHVEAGFFKVIEFKRNGHYGVQTLVTPQGRRHFLQCYFDGIMEQGKLF